MLYPLHLLIVEPGEAPRLQPLRQRRWRPMVLVPRQLCIFEAVPCAQVRWHELAGFVQLQVQRLSPFARPAATALRRGGRLLLWIWDANEVDALLTAADPTAPLRVTAAENLYLSLPSGEGEHKRRCTQGLERLKVDRDGLAQAQFLEILPPEPACLTAKPVGRDWSQSLAAEGFLGQLNGVGLFSGLAWVGALAMACAAVFQWAALQGALRAEAELEQTLARQMVVGGERAETRRKTEQDLEWVRTYENGARQIDVPALLQALRPLLERQGVVIREWESQIDSVKLVLASAGGDIRLPELLDELKMTPGLSEVQMQQHEELAAVTIVFRPQGWMLGRVGAADGN